MEIYSYRSWWTNYIALYDYISECESYCVIFCAIVLPQSSPICPPSLWIARFSSLTDVSGVTRRVQTVRPARVATTTLTCLRYGLNLLWCHPQSRVDLVVGKPCTKKKKTWRNWDLTTIKWWSNMVQWWLENHGFKPSQIFTWESTGIVVPTKG